MTTKARKDSYTVPCSSQFRDAINQLADRRRVNVGDLARSILLTVPEDKIRSVPDPGGPPPGDREETVLKSGPSEGRPWRRKPRLQVRLASGYDTSTVRCALNLALSLDREDLQLELIDPAEATEAPAEITEELERLRAIVSVLAFDPLKDGVQSRSDALHVLGFAPGARPDRTAIRNRFRMLATIHHPDSHYGNHQRMSQLNAAMEVLKA
ncbi:MAG: J domain-containing protein [Rhodospirillaceae bacterium]